MRMMLLLAVALGAMAVVPTSASAQDHGVIHSQTLSSFGLSILVRDAPKVIQHRHYPARHLGPQPWPRRFTHHAPRSGWHKPWRPGPWYFHRPFGAHERWSRGPGWPAHPTVRHQLPNGRDFRHGERHDRGHHR